MKKIFVGLKWFLAFSKRLLKRPSFILTLLIIPVVTFSMSLVGEQESGVLTVALASNGEKTPVYEDIVDELTGRASSMLYYEAESVRDAIEDVRDGKANWVWIFAEDLPSAMSAYARAESSEPLCEVYLKEDTIIMQLTREKLHSILYKHLSYDIFVDYMNRKELDIEEANEAEYRRYFDEQNALMKNGVIDFKFYNAPEKTIEDVNYLTSPLRGMLATAILVCCLAEMMFSLEDECAGKYGMFPVSRRLSLHITAVLASGVLSSIAVFVALRCSGIIKGDLYDVHLLLLYAIMTVGFCVFVGIIVRAPSKLCIAFPILTVATIALCPIFVNTSSFVPVKSLLPTYHYLLSTNDVSHVKYMVLYAIVIYLLDVAAYKMLNRE